MMKYAATALCASLLISIPVHAQETSASALVSSFMEAWNAADAKSLSALFAEDGDLVTPTGVNANGRSAIEAFYASAFARGYRGSKGEGVILHERALSPDMSLIDARFAISGARNQDGLARAGETGILAAVIARTETGWQIVALRENEGAGDLSAFPPPH